MFSLQGEVLEFTIEDIYFTIVLSCLGVELNLKGLVHGVGALTVHDYINMYCVSRAQKSGSQISIGKITSFPLKFIVTNIKRVVGVETLHL